MTTGTPKTLRFLNWELFPLPYVASPWWRPATLGLFLVAQLLNLLDLLTTLAGLWLGAEEGGWLLAWLIGNSVSPAIPVLVVRGAYAVGLLGLFMAARASWATPWSRGFSIVGGSVLVGFELVFARVVTHNAAVIFSLG